MLKLYCFITGDDYNTLANDTLKSRKKVILYAWSILIPVLIWFTCGYLLVTNILKGSETAAFLTAFIVSLIVYVIERSIILSGGGWRIAAFRITLAVFVALIGALIIDEIVFENDIDQQLAKNQRTEVESELMAFDSLWTVKISAQVEIVQKSNANWDSAVRRIDTELNGKSGTRIPGYGPIAKIMQENADKYKLEYLMQSNALDTLKAKHERIRAQEIERITSSFNNHSLLKRMKAMFDLAKSDWLMLLVYMVFTAIFLLLECMVVVIKLSSGKTNYEKKQDMIEEIGEKRMKRITGHNDTYFDPAKSTAASKRLAKDIARNGSNIFKS